MDRGQRHKAREFQQLERMRDSLIDGDDTVMEEISNRFPDADIQKLRQFVRNARKEKKKTSHLNTHAPSSDIFANFRQKTEVSAIFSSQFQQESKITPSASNRRFKTELIPCNLLNFILRGSSLETVSKEWISFFIAFISG